MKNHSKPVIHLSKKLNPLPILKIQLNGFTLLEVLISFAVLASILAVIIQSQSEMVFFLQKTDKLNTAQSVVIHELQKLELKPKNEIASATGIFPENHPMAGDKWTIQLFPEKFINLIPILKITYQVTWMKNKKPQTYGLSIYK